MNGMVIRITGTKREVGIVKTSVQRDEALPIIEGKGDVKFPMNQQDVGQIHVGLNFKCFDKYRNSHEQSSTSNIEPYKITDNSNNHIPDKATKPLVKPTLIESNNRGLKDFDSIFVSECNIDASLKETKRLIKMKNKENRDGKYLKCPYNRSTEQKNTKDIQYDSSDEESKKGHPNRRLQLERDDCNSPTKRIRLDSEMGKKKEGIEPSKLRSVVRVVRKQGSSEPSVTTLGGVKVGKEEKEVPIRANIEGKEHTKHSASGMWERVINSPRLWEEESYNLQETSDSDMSGDEWDGEETAVDYTRLLNEFVLKTQKEKEKTKGLTLYEKRVKEMMEDPDCDNWVKDFYIPPALVEVLNHKMAQDQTAEASVRRICEAMEWPEAVYTCRTSGKEGFVYSCTLNTKTFTPAKPASNEDLAKELAAVECLEWLGFQQGKPPLLDTYFP